MLIRGTKGKDARGYVVGTSWFQKSQTTHEISLVLPVLGLMPRLTCATVWSPTLLTSGPAPTRPMRRTCNKQRWSASSS